MPSIQVQTLVLDVYRSAGSDTSREGISAHSERLYLVGAWDATQPSPYIPLADAPTAEIALDEPTVILMRHPTIASIAHIVPAKWDPFTKDWKPFDHGMAGGNYAYTLDSRFSRLYHRLTGNCLAGPVSIHDRYEWGPLP